jgi:hypothetical protein
MHYQEYTIKNTLSRIHYQEYTIKNTLSIIHHLLNGTVYTKCTAISYTSAALGVVVVVSYCCLADNLLLPAEVYRK